MFHGHIFGATSVNRSSNEVGFKLVLLNLFANRFLVQVNQMFGNVALFDVVVITTPLTNMRVIFKSTFPSVKTLFCLIILLVLSIFL
jgi:hypothetical protein